MERVKVSVIMLAYNIGAYVEMAIRGVLCQRTTYKVELVIGEDCSTDGTLDICRQYEERYPGQIKVIAHKQNLGLQRNFLDTHRHCTGEYIAICDGDDYWFDPHKLQRMTDFMDTHPDFAICFHRVINYYEESHEKSLSNGGQRRITDINDLARSNYITNSSSLFRRSYYPVPPAWLADITSCDYAMHMLNAQFGKIYYFKRPMAVYRKHAAGVWSEVQTSRMLTTALAAREKLLDYFQTTRPEVYELLRQSHTQICLNLLRHYRRHSSTPTPPTDIQAAEERLLRYQPQWTPAAIDIHLVKPHQSPWKRFKSFFMRFLKGIRKVGSRLIPLPNIPL